MTRYRVFLLLALLLLVLIGGVFATPGIIEGKYNRVRKEPPYAVPAAASELQQNLFVTDLHADSGRNLLSRSTTGHVEVVAII